MVLDKIEALYLQETILVRVKRDIQNANHFCGSGFSARCIFKMEFFSISLAHHVGVHSDTCTHWPCGC